MSDKYYRRLEYSPHVDYTPEQHDAVPYIDNSESILHAPVTWTSGVGRWHETNELLRNTDDLMHLITRRLGNQPTSIDIGEDILRAIETKYGIQFPDNGVTFQLYQEMIKYKGDPLARQIVRLYERAHEMLDGNYQVELYPVLADIQDDLLGLDALMKNALFNLLVPDITHNNFSDDLLELAEEAEKQRASAVVAMLDERRRLIDSVVEPDLDPRISSLNEQLRKYTDEARVLNGIKDACQHKLVGIAPILEDIELMLDMNSAEFLGSEQGPVARELLRARTGDIKEQLREQNLLFQGFCDHKSKYIRTNKNQLRDVVADKLREPAEHAITTMAHYRYKTATPAMEWLMRICEDGMNTIDPSATHMPTAFFTVAELMAESLIYADRDYDKSLMMYGNLSRSAEKLRRQITDSIRQKERLRCLSRVTDQLIEQSLDRDQLLDWTHDGLASEEDGS